MSKLVLFLFVLSGCFSSYHNLEKSSSASNGRNNHQLSASLFLENRVGNCDSAIVYMKNVVVPMGVKDLDTIMSMVVSVNVKYRIPGETKFLRKNRSISSYDTGSYRFYISSSCFVGRPLEDVLDVFCTARDKKMLLMNNILVRDFGRKTWDVIFSDGVGNLDGVIIDSTGMVTDVVKFFFDRELD